MTAHSVPVSPRRNTAAPAARTSASCVIPASSHPPNLTPPSPRSYPARDDGRPRCHAGKRERTKAANRAAILEAARGVFGESGFGAASVRDIIRRTDLAAGTFYNYFPDKPSIFTALLDDVGAEARRRVQAARRS